MQLCSLSCAFAIVASACASDSKVPDAPVEKPDTLVTNGRIYLGAPEWRAVDALLVRDGRVVVAGTEAEARSAAHVNPDIVDLQGAVAVPGLQDAHGHVEGYGAALESVDLRGVASYGELIERVARRAAELPPGEWLEGRGWDQNLWPEKTFPHHRALSERVPDRPVLLTRVDGHAVLVNARALEIAGLDEPQPSETGVQGGQILLDEHHMPTGVFVDAATALVAQHVPAPSREARLRRFRRAQDALLAVGLTAVHDMGVDPAAVDLLDGLRASGALKLRMIEYLRGNAGFQPGALDRFPIAPDPEDRLCVIGVKLLVDGALGSRGAALLADYADAPGHQGLLQLPTSELRKRIALCAEHGLQPAIHAIGDRGNREVLDAYEERMKLDPSFAALRPRIEHAQIVAPEDWGRFASLGVIPSMQPTHATSDMRWVPERLGPERVAGAYAWRRLDPTLTRLAFGSDVPVEEPNPLAGVYAAITRQDANGWPEGGWLPDQRLDARAALAAFTSGAAFAVHQEDRRGKLVPGYFADLTVVDVDPIACAPGDLLKARVLLTVINGDVVYRAK